MGKSVKQLQMEVKKLEEKKKKEALQKKIKELKGGKKSKVKKALARFGDNIVRNFA